MIYTILTSYFFWVLLIIAIGIKAYVKWTTAKCQSRMRVIGKTVIITGATSGIGEATALALAHRGARIILACRDLEKGKEVREKIIAQTNNKKIEVHHLDLTSLESVRSFVNNIINVEPQIDILINNAGAAGLGNKQTKDNLQIGMQVNHFGPFLLTCLLIDKMKKSASARIIMVSSLLHHCAKFDINNLNFEKSFDENQVYFYGKLANLLMANELARKLKGTSITVNSCHPGFVPTKIWKHLSPTMYSIATLILQKLFKSPHEGCQTSVYLACEPKLNDVTGKYFSECKETRPSKRALNETLAKNLWEKSEILVGLKPEEKCF